MAVSSCSDMIGSKVQKFVEKSLERLEFESSRVH